MITVEFSGHLCAGGLHDGLGPEHLHLVIVRHLDAAARVDHRLVHQVSRLVRLGVVAGGEVNIRLLDGFGVRLVFRLNAVVLLLVHCLVQRRTKRGAVAVRGGGERAGRGGAIRVGGGGVVGSECFGLTFPYTATTTDPILRKARKN